MIFRMAPKMPRTEPLMLETRPVASVLVFADAAEEEGTMVVTWNSANLAATCASCNCVIKRMHTCYTFRCWEGISNPGGNWYLVVGVINILSCVFIPHLGTLIIAIRSTLSLFDPSCFMQLAFNIYDYFQTRFCLL